MKLGETYTGLRLEIYNEFNALLDYIWKTPEFIEGQIALERRKLDAYFPAQSGPNANSRMAYLRMLRSMHESPKLFENFPRYLAASNLFLAASIFEKFLYEICKAVESADFQISNHRGNGVARYLSFLTNLGVEPQKAELYFQIDAAITFRNALLHADGRMDICRDSVKIRQIISGLLYLEPKQRAKGEPFDEFGNPEVRLSGDPL